ncbi:hypothetical protein [Paraburkholderia sp.]|uniref:hypothetical protein n=1 Tax=Paraburkholderia sp. TaxID=1926495 RepID=UPI0039E4746B
MTGLASPASLIRYFAILGAAIVLVGCSQSAVQHGKNSQIAKADMTLWQTIDAVAQQIPFTRTRIESLLVTQLVEKDTSRDPIQNTAFQFYTGGPLKLSDDVVISNVDLRIRHRAGHPGFLVLNLDSSCITLDTVRAHYHGIRLTDHPRGRSLDEAASYSAFPEWGKLSFGFKERNRSCLTYVVLNPRFNEDNTE